MTGKGNGLPTGKRAAAAEGRAQGLDIGWTVFSYLLAGMAAYGAIGWLIGRAVHVSVLFPIGMLVGLAISLGYIIYRYGRGGLGGNGFPSGSGGSPGGSSPRGRKGDDR